MSHLLVIDLPGGNDGDVLWAALSLGHRYTLASGDPAHYRRQAALGPLLDRAGAMLELPADGDDWVPQLLAAHRADPFDAVLCLQDLRLVESARIANELGLRHVSTCAALCCRDKAAVRTCLAHAGLAHAGLVQAPYVLVEPGADAGGRLIVAVARVGLPAIVKPVDGFGSQHVFGLRNAADLEILRHLADLIAQGPGDYGLGNAASGALLVERLFDGPLLGCDVMRSGGRQVLLGVNAKIMAVPPSFAILGGCFTANAGQFAALDQWLGLVLDAAGFDHGAAHVELVMTKEGPQLVEINPRLVGARLARMIDAATGRSVHADLIDLHLSGTLPPIADRPRHAVARWLIARDAGVLAGIDWPECDDPALVGVVENAQRGQAVRPALDNADRLAMVITAGADATVIEALAMRVIADAQIRLRVAEPASCTD
jgi:biotin carboxylase